MHFWFRFWCHEKFISSNCNFHNWLNIFKQELLPFSLQHCSLCLFICHNWRYLLIFSMFPWTEKAAWACQSWKIWRSTSTYVDFICPHSSHTFGIIINIIDNDRIYCGMWKHSRICQVGHFFLQFKPRPFKFLPLHCALEYKRMMVRWIFDHLHFP